MHGSQRASSRRSRRRKLAAACAVIVALGLLWPLGSALVRQVAGWLVLASVAGYLLWWFRHNKEVEPYRRLHVVSMASVVSILPVLSLWGWSAGVVATFFGVWGQITCWDQSQKDH